ncbi:hypothetical protein KUM39_14010 [Streptomyces sp. J2-1]|uniref:hypothetical protein n=1 Tax=Streptomyces corallincola TaxID=2851888 RepID=UPI001C3807FB|nr:hypothetical protein [Streptomyces corallincola]MBV2355469.1 hypothetical protein [Streptomyces corallincola]
MHLDWNALGQVTAVSIGVTVAVVAVFTLGVLCLARSAEARDHNSTSSTTSSPEPSGTARSLSGQVQATLCFLACAAVVVYGIYLIVPQFH